MKLKDLIHILFTYKEIHIEEIFCDKDTGKFIRNHVIYQEDANSIRLGYHAIDVTKIDERYFSREISRYSDDRLYNRIWIEIRTFI